MVTEKNSDPAAIKPSDIWDWAARFSVMLEGLTEKLTTEYSLTWASGSGSALELFKDNFEQKLELLSTKRENGFTHHEQEVARYIEFREAENKNNKSSEDSSGDKNAEKSKDKGFTAKDRYNLEKDQREWAKDARHEIEYSFRPP